MSDNNNGYDPAEAALEEAFKSAGKLRLNDMSGENGTLTYAGPMTQSLLHRIISVNSQDFNSELKISNWASYDEADRAAAALYECKKLGLDPTPVEMQINARNASIHHGLVRIIAETLTHTTFTTNYRSKNDSGKGKGSPLPS